MIVIGLNRNLVAGQWTENLPLDSELTNAFWDEGQAKVIYYYVQKNFGTEPLSKTRTFELIPPVVEVPNTGRALIDVLSNGWAFVEVTESTLPDRRVRDA